MQKVSINGEFLYGEFFGKEQTLGKIGYWNVTGGLSINW
jgi:hypothetical protein